MSFNPKQTKDSIVQWIRNYFEENGPKCSAVVGISGGKDSTVVAALCVEALGKDRVIGVLMPNGSQQDIQDSFDLVEMLGIKHYTINISDAIKKLALGLLYLYADDRTGKSESSGPYPYGYVVCGCAVAP